MKCLKLVRPAESALSGRGEWPQELDRRCQEKIQSILVAQPGSREQTGAWGELFGDICQPLEEWCRQSRLLRRAGLTTEDDWRGVLLRVIERLVQRDYANLRAYQRAREEHLRQGTQGRTPFEGWLRKLLQFALADEISRQLAVRRTHPVGGVQTVERLGAFTKTPATSIVTNMEKQQRSQSIRRALEHLDLNQKCALLQRVDGASYEEIAQALEVTRQQAVNIVRSAKARLRRLLRQNQKQQD